jgi:hypothetical protein
MSENFDEAESRFVVETFTLQMEHSLVSLSKWESEFEKPFLGDGEKTAEETLSYIRAMTLTPDVPPEVFYNLSTENVEDINKYINGKHTATRFREAVHRPSREIITAEIIYSWMIALTVPIEWGETRHLNQLFTVIKVANEKNQTPKKMSKREIAAQNAKLNAQRKAQLNSKG